MGQIKYLAILSVFLYSCNPSIQLVYSPFYKNIKLINNEGYLISKIQVKTESTNPDSIIFETKELNGNGVILLDSILLGRIQKYNPNSIYFNIFIYSKSNSTYFIVPLVLKDKQDSIFYPYGRR